MSNSDDLEKIADQMEFIRKSFTRTQSGLHIVPEHNALFKGLVHEASDIIKDALGLGNSFSRPLLVAQVTGETNFFSSQSYASVDECTEIVRSAIRAIRRKEAQPAGSAAGPKPTYVSLSRVNELREIRSQQWDLRRLIRMCEEINSAFAAGNYIATAMILRAIVDHVPPLFGAKSFPVYVASINGRSHKGAMENLQGAMRNIADGILHVQIRQQEVLPNESQVDFRQVLDVLLGEVVRVLR